MWESFAFGANIVLPSFILILIGRLITLRKLASHEEMDKIAKLTFKYSLSTKIFMDLAVNDPSSFSNYRMVGYIMAMVLILFFVVWLIAGLTLKKKDSVGSFVQSSFRCSFTVLGMSMVDSFAGSEGVAKCALLLAATAIVFNILASIVLTKKDENSSLAKTLKKIGKSVVTNPLIIASVLGMAASYAGVQLPSVIQKPLTNIGNMAPPLSLLCIGSSLNLDRIKGSLLYASIASVIKTFGEALIAIPVAVLLGFRGFELIVIAIFFTAANPSANYVMALATDSDSDLAATGIVLSTILCVFSSTIALMILRATGLV